MSFFANAFIGLVYIIILIGIINMIFQFIKLLIYLYNYLISCNNMNCNNMNCNNMNCTRFLFCNKKKNKIIPIEKKKYLLIKGPFDKNYIGTISNV